MMKRLFAIVLPLLVAASCGSPNMTAAAKTAKTAKPAKTAVKKKTAAKESTSVKDPAAAYQDLITFYDALVRNPYAYEGDGNAGFVEAACSLGKDAPAEMGCLIQDLSGDGVPELVVGQLGGPVFAVYTQVGGRPYLVFEGWYRNSYVYAGDGSFYNTASASASSSGVGTFRLSKDGTKLQCESFLFTAADKKGKLSVYRNRTGSWDPADSQKTAMTVEDFWSMEAPEASLPLVRFSGTKSEKGSTRKASSRPVTVSHLPDPGYIEYEWVVLYDGDGASCIFFTADSTVTDFTLLNLFAEDATETGAVIFDAAPVVSDEQQTIPTVLTPDNRLAVQLVFYGDLPTFGFSYKDADGKLRRFAVEVSGKDSSLSLREADPNETQFILPGTFTR